MDARCRLSLCRNGCVPADLTTRIQVEVQLGGSVESFEPFEPNAAGGQDDPQGTLLRGVIEFGLLSSFGRSNEAVFEVSVADAPNITPPHLTAHEAEKRVPVGWPIYCFIVILFGLCFYSTAFALYFLLRRTPLS